MQRGIEGGDRIRAGRWLPAAFTILFSLFTLKVLLFDVLPGWRELRAAEKAHAFQRTRERRLLDRGERLRRRLRSLREDPQAWERALDAKGVLPPRPDHPETRR